MISINEVSAVLHSLSSLVYFLRFLERSTVLGVGLMVCMVCGEGLSHRDLREVGPHKRLHTA
jgi:hypothetical protein